QCKRSKLPGIHSFSMQSAVSRRRLKPSSHARLGCKMVGKCRGRLYIRSQEESKLYWRGGLDEESCHLPTTNLDDCSSFCDGRPLVHHDSNALYNLQSWLTNPELRLWKTAHPSQAAIR